MGLSAALFSVPNRVCMWVTIYEQCTVVLNKGLSKALIHCPYTTLNRCAAQLYH